MTDTPESVSPVLSLMASSLNDALPDDARQRLLPLVPLMAGTAGDGLDEARRYMALDWMVRTYTPAWLDLAGLTDHADALRSLDPIADSAAFRTVIPVVRAAANKSSVEGPWDRSEVGDVARSAAWSASRRTSRQAFWTASRSAVWNAVWNAAGDAAWNSARNVAGYAARNVIGVARPVAARNALAPTVAHLQDSAVQLLREMIRPTA